MFNRSAARLKCNSSATATKQRNWLSSNIYSPSVSIIEIQFFIDIRSFNQTRKADCHSLTITQLAQAPKCDSPRHTIFSSRTKKPIQLDRFF
jgi:hypothetical protein